MTTLREEIIEFLGSNDAYVLNEEFIDTEHCGDQILKLIEKRIEEAYQSDEVIGYSGDAEVSYGITLFHNMIKKELLK